MSLGTVLLIDGFWKADSWHRPNVVLVSLSLVVRARMLLASNLFLPRQSDALL